MVVCAIVVGWVILPNNPVDANPFAAYSSYMPGEDARGLLANEDCETRYYDFRDEYEDYLWCDLDDGIVRSVVITINSNRQIKGVYFFLVQCAVNAGELILWYGADVQAIRHGARIITWSGGKASCWYPRKSYWTPNVCLWGVWFWADV